MAIRKRTDRWYRSSFFLLMVAVIGSPPQARAEVYASNLKLVTEETTLKGMIDGDSPTVLSTAGKTWMWVSGQVNKAAGQRNAIFVSEKTDAGWSQPYAAIYKPGYEIGEPSVIRHPDKDWFYMYYTMTPPAKAGQDATDRQPGIGFALGRYCQDYRGELQICWDDQSEKTPFIGADGSKTAGARSPSAMVAGNQIWLYYKTEGPDGQWVRTGMDLASSQKYKTEPLIFQRYHPHRYKWDMIPPSDQAVYSGIDVAALGKNKYMMVANAGARSGLARLESDNGLHFHYVDGDQNAAFIGKGGVQMSTPDIVPISENEFTVFMAYADEKSECSKMMALGGAYYACSQEIRAMRIKKEPPKQLSDAVAQ